MGLVCAFFLPPVEAVWVSVGIAAASKPHAFLCHAHFSQLQELGVLLVLPALIFAIIRAAASPSSSPQGLGKHPSPSPPPFFSRNHCAWDMITGNVVETKVVNSRPA